MKLEDFKKLIRQKEDIAEQKEEALDKIQKNHKNSNLALIGAVGASLAYVATASIATVTGINQIYNVMQSSFGMQSSIIGSFGFAAGAIGMGSGMYYWMKETLEPVFSTTFEMIGNFQIKNIEKKENECKNALADEKEIKTIAKAIENHTLSEHLSEKEAEKYKKDKDNYIVLPKKNSTVEELSLMGCSNIYENRDRKNLYIVSLNNHIDNALEHTTAYTVIQSDYIANCKDSFIIDKRNAHSSIILANIRNTENDERLQLVERDIDLSKLSTRDGKKAIQEQVMITEQFGCNNNVFKEMMANCAKQNGMVLEKDKSILKNNKTSNVRLKPNIKKDKQIELNNTNLVDMR